MIDTEIKLQARLGSKHWLFQTIPPSLMLLILFATRDGSAMVFLAGLFVLPALFSLISIIAKLIFFKKRKYYLLRPVLTISFFMLIFEIAHWRYTEALELVTNAARQIQTQCNTDYTCPRQPAGWKVNGKRVSQRFGSWLPYTASYYYHEHAFDIRVYQGPDLGHNITGGVGVDFEVKPYVENQ